ncbi:Protein UGT-61 [Aphelenchoides avenae]|nr:Protein UGT-61 [Aphelenchus avenae]
MGHGDLSGYSNHPRIRVFTNVVNGQREGAVASRSRPQKSMGFSEFSAKICERLLNNRGLIDEFLTAGFDVVFTHTYNYCPIGLTYTANISSWIWLAGGPLPEYVTQETALPTAPSYVPPVHLDATDRMTFIQRLQSFFLHGLTPLAHFRHIGPAEDVAFRKAGYTHLPPLRELSRKAPLVMVNNDELLDFPRPGLHSVVNIGGIGLKQTATPTLGEPFSTTVSSADSVVLFSLGSVANPLQMPLAMKAAFLRAFARRPHVTFIFRYDGKDLDGIRPRNVHVFPWISQAELLGHSKVRAIITHGGFNSLMEIVKAGKPMICIPLFGDQFRNCRLAEHLGIAKVVRTNEINEETIHAALQAIIHEDRYASAARRLQSMLDGRKEAAAKSLLHWTELLAKGERLSAISPRGAMLSFIVYNNIDVLASGLVFFMMLTSAMTT